MVCPRTHYAENIALLVVALGGLTPSHLYVIPYIVFFHVATMVYFVAHWFFYVQLFGGLVKGSWRGALGEA